MPQSATALLDQLKIAPENRGFDKLAGYRRDDLPVTIEKPQAVFPRYFEPEASA